jgi:hypothetical protein
MSDVVTRLLVGVPESDGDGAPFMVHCHLLRHEDDGAMGQFRVVGCQGTARSGGGGVLPNAEVVVLRAKGGGLGS